MEHRELETSVTLKLSKGPNRSSVKVQLPATSFNFELCKVCRPCKSFDALLLIKLHVLKFCFISKLLNEILEATFKQNCNEQYADEVAEDFEQWMFVVLEFFWTVIEQ